MLQKFSAINSSFQENLDCNLDMFATVTETENSSFMKHHVTTEPQIGKGRSLIRYNDKF